MKSSAHTAPFVQRLLRAWFGLTRDEQLALLLVLGLFLLGLGVRAWHQARLHQATGAPPSERFQGTR